MSQMLGPSSNADQKLFAQNVKIIIIIKLCIYTTWTWKIQWKSVVQCSWKILYMFSKWIWMPMSSSSMAFTPFVRTPWRVRSWIRDLLNTCVTYQLRKVQEEFVTQRQYFAQHDIVTTKTLAYRDLYFTVHAPPKVYLLFPFYKPYHVDPWRATMRPENIRGRIEAKKRWP